MENGKLRDVIVGLGCERVRLVLDGEEGNILYDANNCGLDGIPEELLYLEVINIRAMSSPDDFLIILENKENK